MFLVSSRKFIDHEAWLVNSSTSFHMTPQREWFCKYERFDSGDIFLGDESIIIILGVIGHFVASGQ